MRTSMTGMTRRRSGGPGFEGITKECTDGGHASRAIAADSRTASHSKPTGNEIMPTGSALDAAAGAQAAADAQRAGRDHRHATGEAG